MNRLCKWFSIIGVMGLMIPRLLLAVEPVRPVLLGPAEERFSYMLADVTGRTETYALTSLRTGDLAVSLHFDRGKHSDVTLIEPLDADGHVIAVYAYLERYDSPRGSSISVHTQYFQLGDKTATHLRVTYDAIDSNSTVTGEIVVRTFINDLISVNFRGDRASGGYSIGFSSIGGLAAGNRWRNLDGFSGTSERLPLSGFLSEPSVQASMTWKATSINSYLGFAYDSEFMNGFINDYSSSISIVVRDIPFENYDIIVYQTHSQANPSVPLHAPKVNGTYYTFDGSTGTTIVAPIQEKQRSENTYGMTHANKMQFGTSALYISDLRGPLTIDIDQGYTHDNKLIRGGIAGFQIVGHSVPQKGGEGVLTTESIGINMRGDVPTLTGDTTFGYESAVIPYKYWNEVTSESAENMIDPMIDHKGASVGGSFSMKTGPAYETETSNLVLRGTYRGKQRMIYAGIPYDQYTVILYRNMYALNAGRKYSPLKLNNTFYSYDGAGNLVQSKDVTDGTIQGWGNPRELSTATVGHNTMVISGVTARDLTFELDNTVGVPNPVELDWASPGADITGTIAALQIIKEEGAPINGMLADDGLWSSATWEQDITNNAIFRNLVLDIGGRTTLTLDETFFAETLTLINIGAGGLTLIAMPDQSYNIPAFNLGLYAEGVTIRDFRSRPIFVGGGEGTTITIADVISTSTIVPYSDYPTIFTAGTADNVNATIDLSGGGSIELAGAAPYAIAAITIGNVPASLAVSGTMFAKADITSSVAFVAAGGTLNTDTYSLAFHSPVTGETLSKAGVGSLTLASNNAHTGTTLLEGKLILTGEIPFVVGGTAHALNLGVADTERVTLDLMGVTSPTDQPYAIHADIVINGPTMILARGGTVINSVTMPTLGLLDIQVTLSPGQILAGQPVTLCSTTVGGGSVVQANYVVIDGNGNPVTGVLDGGTFTPQLESRTVTCTPTIVGDYAVATWRKGMEFDYEGGKTELRLGDTVVLQDVGYPIYLQVEGAVVAKHLILQGDTTIMGVDVLTFDTLEVTQDKMLYLQAPVVATTTVIKGSLEVLPAGIATKWVKFVPTEAKGSAMTPTKYFDELAPIGIAELRLCDEYGAYIPWPEGSIVTSPGIDMSTPVNVSWTSLIDGLYYDCGKPNPYGGKNNDNRWAPTKTADAPWTEEGVANGELWAKIELPEMMTFNKYKFITYEEMTRCAPRDWMLQVSIDGESWITVDRQEGHMFNEFEWFESDMLPAPSLQSETVTLSATGVLPARGTISTNTISFASGATIIPLADSVLTLRPIGDGTTVTCEGHAFVDVASFVDNVTMIAPAEGVSLAGYPTFELSKPIVGREDIEMIFDATGLSIFIPAKALTWTGSLDAIWGVGLDYVSAWEEIIPFVQGDTVIFPAPVAGVTMTIPVSGKVSPAAMSFEGGDNVYVFERNGDGEALVTVAIVSPATEGHAEVVKALNTSITLRGVGLANVEIAQDKKISIDVPQDTSYVVALSNLSGKGTVHKTGLGTVTITGSGNYYTGGFVAEAGLTKFDNDKPFGRYAVEDPTSTMPQIYAGATIDSNGYYNCYAYTIAGHGTEGQGALINTGRDRGIGFAQMYGLTLTANASIGGTGEFGLVRPSYADVTLDLAGYTLTKVGGNTFLMSNVTSTAGQIKITQGTIRPSKACDLQASLVTIDQGASLTVNVATTVGSLTTSGSVSGGSALTIAPSGSLTLTGDDLTFAPPLTFGDGATFNLAHLTKPWARGFTLAADRSLIVDLTGRTLPLGETQLIEWTTQPAGTITLKNAPAGQTIEKRTEGLFVTVLEPVTIVDGTVTDAVKLSVNILAAGKAKTITAKQANLLYLFNAKSWPIDLNAVDFTITDCVIVEGNKTVSLTVTIVGVEIGDTLKGTVGLLGGASLNSLGTTGVTSTQVGNTFIFSSVPVTSGPFFKATVSGE